MLATVVIRIDYEFLLFGVTSTLFDLFCCRLFLRMLCRRVLSIARRNKRIDHYARHGVSPRCGRHRAMGGAVTELR